MFPNQANAERFFAATLGASIAVSIANGSATRSAQLSPGRYLVHYTALSDTTAGVFWVQQGGSTVAVAAAAVPATPMGPGASVRSIEILVQPGVPTVTAGATAPSVATPTTDYLSVWGAGITGSLILTRISGV
jgi:hypothetical protein